MCAYVFTSVNVSLHICLSVLVCVFGGEEKRATQGERGRGEAGRQGGREGGRERREGERVRERERQRGNKRTNKKVR